MNPVFLVYWRSTPHCPWCHSAMALLDSRSIPYSKVDIALAGPDRDLAFQRIQKEGWKSVPAIFELTPEGEIKSFIGGYDKLAAELENRI